MLPTPSRNAPCPCGSGRRYKDCHGALSGDATRATPPAAGDAIDPLLHAALAAQRAGDLETAEASYRAVLAQAPAHFDALHMLGVVRYERGDADEAATLIERSLASFGAHAPAHHNLALARIAQDRLDDALASLDRALALDPQFVHAQASRGNVLAAWKRHAEAVACFDRVLAVRPDDVDLRSNRANALLELRRYDEAARDFAAIVEAQPDYPYALGNLLHCRRQLADWTSSALEAQLREAVDSGLPRVTPLAFLALTDDARAQLACARSFAQRRYPPVAPGSAPAVARDTRIRVAYVSPDFRDHAVALLISGLIERHDRDRFEVTGIAFGPPDDSPARRRLMRAFDAFVDVTRESDAAAAARLRALGVDIAVDLAGYTAHSRAGIFAHRAAPIQVSYLGFPGTLGAPCYDYLIADDFVVPQGADVHYAERIVRMPDSFQVNDDRRARPGATATRAQAGLPPHGFVFACFNAVYKIGPAMFDAWMRILRAMPDSMLWLVAEHPFARDNLAAEARRRGVDPARLIFAPRLPYVDYLARLPLVDLFVDSLPFNAGTTASDALWMGVPVLTCCGEAYAARMAGSLLRAAGLPQLVTHDLAAYEQRAVELARDADGLARLRAHLAAGATLPLFDTDRWRRCIEAAFTIMVERHRRGEPPAALTVPAR
jgi:predicted O-linked N-acetylglucosamine transferase (SPINDLY family)